MLHGQGHALARGRLHLAGEAGVHAVDGFGQAESQDLGVGREEPPAPWVVHVHDPAFVLGRVFVEEPGLGVEIGVHVHVVVQVVLGHVGKHGAVEAQAGGAALVQGVGGDLHDHHVHVAALHVGQQFVELPAVRGGELCVQGEAGPAVVDRAQDADLEAARREQMLDHVGHGGFAVGAGDAHQLERVRVGPEMDPGQLSQGHAGVGMDHQPGAAFLIQAGDLAGVLAADHVARFALHGVGDERGAVHLHPRDGHENLPGLHVGGVGADHESVLDFVHQFEPDAGASAFHV